MDVSKLLSKVSGILLLIVGIAMFKGMDQLLTCINGYIHDAPLMFITGFFILILGLLMVVSHNIWQWNWRVIITLIAWAVLFKGACILLFPQIITDATVIFLQNSTIPYVAAGFNCVMGILLSYFGFKR